MSRPPITSHGYAINEDVRKLLENPSETLDCGGPGRCTRCTAEATDYFAIQKTAVPTTEYAIQLYPRKEAALIVFDDPKKASRRWHVAYKLRYDNGEIEWRGYYRFQTTARIAAAFNYFVKSYGGTIRLIDTKEVR